MTFFYRKLLLRGKTITAEEALDYGLVSEVVWPDKFMETVVPSLEEFEDMPAAGLSIVKRGLMKITKNNITSQVHNLLFPQNFSYYKKQEGRSVNARLYIAAFSHILNNDLK